MEESEVSVTIVLAVAVSELNLNYDDDDDDDGPHSSSIMCAVTTPYNTGQYRLDYLQHLNLLLYA